MAEVRYRGLPEFGLDLVGSHEADFDRLKSEIGTGPGPGPIRPFASSDPGAVLINNTGRALVVLAWFWRYAGAAGTGRTNRFSNFGSGAQRDVLNGRSKVWRDLGTFILPGSKRLITQDGMSGTNRDVLTADELPRSQGFCYGWGGDRSHHDSGEGFTLVELVLDLVILGDGLCVGPDESGLCEALDHSLNMQRTLAQEAVQALEAGASVGSVFELVRPLARPQPAARHGADRAGHSTIFLSAFAHEAIHHLTRLSDSDLLAFFRKAAEPRAFSSAARSEAAASRVPMPATPAAQRA